MTQTSIESAFALECQHAQSHHECDMCGVCADVIRDRRVGYAWTMDMVTFSDRSRHRLWAAEAMHHGAHSLPAELAVRVIR